MLAIAELEFLPRRRLPDVHMNVLRGFEMIRIRSTARHAAATPITSHSWLLDRWLRRNHAGSADGWPAPHTRRCGKNDAVDMTFVRSAFDVSGISLREQAP